jgi:hypothetical protein
MLCERAPLGLAAQPLQIAAQLRELRNPPVQVGDFAVQDLRA